QDERSRASLSCPWKEAWTKSATFYPAAEAAAPDQSTRLCSDAANQSDPSTHGFRDCNPWQGGGASVSILILIAAPKKGGGNYQSPAVYMRHDGGRTFQLSICAMTGEGLSYERLKASTIPLHVESFFKNGKLNTWTVITSIVPLIRFIWQGSQI